MICTSKIRKVGLLGSILVVAAFLMTGCGDKNPVENPYPVYDSVLTEKGDEAVSGEFFAKNLCITDGINFGTEKTQSEVATGAGVFNLDTGDVVYSQNLLDKLYPASTTKVLTAYIITKYGDLDDTVTISEHAAHPGSDSSVAGLRTGDVMTVRNLLYALLLPSGNDAAIALAEYFSGSEEAFAERMNEEALRLGATGSHFVNPSGYPSDEHYTTVYDMYLFMNAAVQQEAFLEICGTPRVKLTINNENGSSRTHEWTNGNQYINGSQRKMPKGVQVLCGKTGTTSAAGYCLVVYGTNEKGERVVGIVFKGDTRSDLYLLMGQILSGFAN